MKRLSLTANAVAKESGSFTGKEGGKGTRLCFASATLRRKEKGLDSWGSEGELVHSRKADFKKN